MNEMIIIVFLCSFSHHFKKRDSLENNYKWNLLLKEEIKKKEKRKKKYYIFICQE